MVHLEGAKTGEKIKMLVDTEATYVILPPSLAEKLGIVSFQGKPKLS
jgi:predicted aspartyl protease